jgi:TIGR03009 family protein
MTMRVFRLSLVTLMLLGTVALAQQPPGTGGAATLGQPLLDPTSRLDTLLLQWEQRMKGVESIQVTDCVRTDKDKEAVKTWKGEARYLKPNLAALRLVQQEDSKFYELLVSTGNFLYEYSPQFQKLRVYELPPPRVGKFDNNLLSFLFGMTATDAKGRYNLTLKKDVSSENPHYVYIDIQPRFENDKREFTRAQMVLFSSTMLPRRLWFLHPNGSEVTWDLPNMNTEVKLKETDFRPPQAPPGWSTVQVPWTQQSAPGDGRPRVIRGGSDK